MQLLSQKCRSALEMVLYQDSATSNLAACSFFCFFFLLVFLSGKWSALILLQNLERLAKEVSLLKRELLLGRGVCRITSRKPNIRASRDDGLG